ncbi:MAG TPA: VacB/RNase II family 3'-5' exoribonuclease [Chlamydiales bacterium]|nr:VacB/RNase II family 3'-5' exoribonuclease [Chlamydiales bacterium]
MKKSVKIQRIISDISQKILCFFEERTMPISERKLLENLQLSETEVFFYKEALKNLKKQKKLEIYKGKISPITHSIINKKFQGPISVHPRGFGFVAVSPKLEVFIPFERLNTAIDGDLVEIEVLSESPKGYEGIVDKVVKRSKKEYLGIIESKKKGILDVYLPDLVDVPYITIKSSKYHVGDRVVVSITDWDKKDEIDGKIIDKIGSIKDPSKDLDAALLRFQLTDDFDEKIIEELKQFKQEILVSDHPDRVDLTDEEIITIDPKTAKDFDDALSLTIDSQGHYHLGVHIADVTYYVRKGSHLDKEAYKRANSTYFPTKCISMLPKELADNLCSLKPYINRLAASVFMEFDPSGNLVNRRISRSIIHSKKRFSYEDAYAVINSNDPSLPHYELLQNLKNLALLLNQKRKERGSIDFALDEKKVIVDDEGIPKKIITVQYDVSHQLVEEFMLKANETVATYLLSQNKQVIFRVHENPDIKDFKEFFSILRILNFKIPPKPTLDDLPKIFIQIKKSPYNEFLSILFIRNLKLAIYSDKNLGHYGLALENYAHFTSPIRRYSDLVLHRLLFEKDPIEKLEEIAAHCSLRERKSFIAESSVVTLKKMRLLQEEKPSHKFKATITKIKPYAIFFDIDHYGLEGKIHVSEMDDDYYQYNPASMMMKGTKTGRKMMLGQKIDLLMVNIDLIQQEITWALA